MGFEPARLEDALETVNTLFYGDGGTGKTTDLTLLSQEGRILVVNAEAGLKKRALAQMGVEVANVDLYPDPEAEGTDAEVTYDGMLAVHDYIKANPNEYVGAHWDSLTEIYQKLLRDVVDQAVAKAERLGKSRDPFFVEMQDYGVMTQQMKTLVRLYRDLPVHFGISALERRDEDDDGAVTYGPAVSPALATDVLGYMDVVIQTSVQEIAGKTEYVGATQPYSKYRAKDRFGALPEKMLSPTYPRILAYVNGEMTKDTDPVVEAARARRTTTTDEAA